MTKTTKLIDGVAGTGEKLAGKSPEAASGIKKAKGIAAGAIGAFAGLFGIKNAELDKWIADNGSINLFGGRKGPEKKYD